MFKMPIIALEGEFMELARSQENILYRLKTRGPQSVKILSNQLDMTTMGVRQHLADLEGKNLVTQTREEKQTRGRPVHLWRLTSSGHARFPDTHSQIALELINAIRTNQGEDSLAQLIESGSRALEMRYRQELINSGDKLQDQVLRLAELRTAEGYMAEVRLIPDGWLLIENHCPIFSAASSCRQFCRSEIRCFQALFAGQADVERIDYLPEGARRCAYKIKPSPSLS